MLQFSGRWSSVPEANSCYGRYFARNTKEVRFRVLHLHEYKRKHIIVIIIIIIIIIIIKLTQEIKNMERKEGTDTDTTGYPISNRTSTIYTYTTVKHNENRSSNQSYTKSCHIRHMPHN
jgi:hypothetical protein